MKKLSVAILLLFPIILSAQDGNKWGATLSGNIRNEIYFDSRQTENTHERNLYLFPKNIRYDQDSLDVNASPSLHILSIQSRLGVHITAPDAFGAKTSGLLEGEFAGSQETGSMAFRLRYAHVKLEWKATELLLGQAGHMLYNEDCYPQVVSINAGAPYAPYSHNPQARLTHHFGNFSVALGALAQMEFSSPGGPTSLSNAIIPEVCLNLQYRSINEEKKTEFLIGAAGEYKTIKPKLATNLNYKTSNKLSTYAGKLFLKLKFKPVSFMLSGLYGQNLYDLTMLGGYAYNYTEDTAIIEKQLFDYTAINNLSAWMDFSTNGEKFQFGLFAGYSKNLGSLKNIYGWENESSFFMRGRDIAYIYRIAPRMVFNSGSVRLALEGDFSNVAYGEKINSLGEVSALKNVYNIRGLFAVSYFFGKSK